MVDLKGYSYSPSRQPLVDKARLRYNEWVAQADGEFGRFMAMLRASGRLQNTAVIVSADHGECFAGGYLGHGGSEQRRPILHVPLLIHLPQQTTGAVITETVDQTALAPTILELTAGARAPWMDGSSLGALLGRGGPAPEAAATQPALAFAQVLESDSVFRPVNQGTLGVIDGRSQYVWSLDNGRGALYALAESDQQKLNRSSLEPELAARLRGEIARRFPTLLGEKA
jgi:arylsulfatase A-like enzyme